MFSGKRLELPGTSRERTGDSVLLVCACSTMDSVPASEAGDPGSTPGGRTSLRSRVAGGYGWHGQPEQATQWRTKAG